MTKQILTAPSILSADLGSLTADIKDVAAHGADWLHIDVMDGVFVPPITFGANVVETARRGCKLFLDVHLMIVRPEEHFAEFIRAGADRVIVHQETCPHLYRTLSALKSEGVQNGVAVNPGTPVNTVYDVLDVCDLVLVMTVNPGWGGQAFLPHCVRKIQALRDEIERRKLPTLIEVDGGINEQTAAACVSAGASVLVAGSYVFGHKDRKAALQSLKLAGV